MHDSSSGSKTHESVLKSLMHKLSSVSLDSKPAKVTIVKRTRSASTSQDFESRATGGRNTFLYKSMANRMKKTQRNSAASSNSENYDSDGEKQVFEKIEHLINELCETEQRYIGTLNDVQMYLNYLQMTMVSKNPDVIDMENYINDIIKHHRDFHMDLNLINNNIQPTESTGQLFLKYKTDLFDFYPELTKYKVRLEQVVCQHGVKELLLVKYKEFQDKLGFPSHLLTIVQRLPKYKLLLIRLTKIFREKQQENNAKLDEAISKLQQAMKMLDETIKLGEDYITIDSIKMQKDDLFQYGKIRLIGQFDSPTMKKVMLLLFEKKIVIAYIRGKLDSELIYADELKLHHLGMNSFEMDPLKIELTDYSKMNFDKPLQIMFIAASAAKKNEWVSELNRQLWTQATKIKETLSKKNGIRMIQQLEEFI